MFEGDNVYSILKTQLFITKLFGLTPFSINSNGPQESKLALGWTIILMITFGSFSLFALISRGHREYGLIMKIGDALNVYLNIISMCCALVYSCFFRKTIMNEIKKLYYLDMDLQKFNFISNIRRSYNQSKMWILLGTTLLMLYLLTALILNIVTYGSQSDSIFIGNVIAYVFPNVINTIMEMQFCTMVLLLRRRFCWLNSKVLEVGDILKNCSKGHVGKNTIKVISGKTNSKHTPQETASLLIGKAKVNHQRLCTISKEINKAFSVQILMLIVTTFLNCVMTLFYWAIRSTSTTMDKLPYADRIYVTNGFALAILEILVIVVVCSATSAEKFISSCVDVLFRKYVLKLKTDYCYKGIQFNAIWNITFLLRMMQYFAKRTGSLIHDVMPPTEILQTKRALQIQLSSFSLQLAQYNVEFNACGVFPINETLLYSIVGAASAYLVIVVQFELSNRETNHTTFNSK